jgi:hypothetical protein
MAKTRLSTPRLFKSAGPNTRYAFLLSAAVFAFLVVALWPILQRGISSAATDVVDATDSTTSTTNACSAENTHHASGYYWTFRWCATVYTDPNNYKHFYMELACYKSTSQTPWLITPKPYTNCNLDTDNAYLSRKPCAPSSGCTPYTRWGPRDFAYVPNTPFTTFLGAAHSGTGYSWKSTGQVRAHFLSSASGSGGYLTPWHTACSKWIQGGYTPYQTSCSDY